MAVDDGTRAWGTELRAELRRPGGGSRNRWLKEGKDGRRNQTLSEEGERGGFPKTASADFTHGAYNSVHDAHAVCNDCERDKGKGVIANNGPSSHDCAIFGEDFPPKDPGHQG